jgi:hypothetical protein
MADTYELFPNHPGYKVEKGVETESICFAYMVRGPKKSWGMMRNEKNPHMLFPVPDNFVTDRAEIRGIEWFTDKNGTLKPAKG